MNSYSIFVLFSIVMALEACTSTGGGKHNDPGKPTEAPPAESKCKESGVEFGAAGADGQLLVSHTFTDAVEGIATITASCSRELTRYKKLEMSLESSTGVVTKPAENKDSTEEKVDVTLTCDEMKGSWTYGADVEVAKVTCEESEKMPCLEDSVELGLGTGGEEGDDKVTSSGYDLTNGVATMTVTCERQVGDKVLDMEFDGVSLDIEAEDEITNTITCNTEDGKWNYEKDNVKHPFEKKITCSEKTLGV